MRAPIFIVSTNGDVSVHDSVAEAETSVESIDVEDGEYLAAYDADGRLLEFHVATPTKRSHFLGSTAIVLTPVRLRPVDHVPAHEGDLRAALIACLEHHGVSIPDATPLDPLEVLFQRHARALSAVSGTGDGLLRRILSRLGLPARKS
jgi:hypothetical protein